MFRHPGPVFQNSRWSAGALLLSVFLMASCNAERGVSTNNVEEPFGEKLSINTPGFLSEARALDPDTLVLRVQVNGNEEQATRVGDSWVLNVRIAPNTPYSLSLEWADTSGLLLARFEALQPAVTMNTALSITSDRYVSSGSAEFDVDDDGFTNLVEADAGTDPNDSNSRPGTVIPEQIMVSLPRIEVAEAPDIDGLYDDIWNSAQFRDTNGERLSIDNLLSNADANTVRTDGNAEFEWAGMHDGTNLYLFVFGENATAQGAAAIGDSTILFHDDSVELFFDGNLSRGSSYDGVDDTSIIVALLDLDGNANGRISRGASDSQPIPEGIEFFNCVCSPVFTWEFSIPLASVNIDPEQPFGLEVQLNDDNTGGNRDSYWGWFQNRASPATFFEPRVMGTISLR